MATNVNAVLLLKSLVSRLPKNHPESLPKLAVQDLQW
jgi:hypothetical protein